MAGYIRQSAASIVPTAVIRATPLNNEFNSLRDAFAVGSGHKHDGTTAEGAFIPVISDTNFRNKVVVDAINHRVTFNVDVDGTSVEQIRIVDGAVLPTTNNDINLGSTTFRYKDAWFAGTITAGAVSGTTGSFTSLTGDSGAFTGGVSALSFSGAGTGLTGTAAALSIGGNAATATNATNAVNASFSVTQAMGNSTKAIATTEFVQQTAFVTALPFQGGNAGKVVTTNGVTASWTALKTINGEAITTTGNISAASPTEAIGYALVFGG